MSTGRSFERVVRIEHLSAERVSELLVELGRMLDQSRDEERASARASGMSEVGLAARFPARGRAKFTI